MAQKPILRALAGETLATPPIWMMRQAGRYLPEYKATRAQAGDFLSLCYNPELAAEVTMQPIRRYGFDAAILFADILLIPQALGAKVWFVTGEGPRLSTITSQADLDKLGPVADVHNTLNPIYETVSRVASALPDPVTLIGFAGAPWTVATYMIAGRGTPDQAPALALMHDQPAVFDALVDRLIDATALYLINQVKAGAEVLKLFDSWAGSLPADKIDQYARQPAEQIIAKVQKAVGDVPFICFPRGASHDAYHSFADMKGVSCLALGQDMDAAWAADQIQPKLCVQGNLNPKHMVTGGDAMVQDIHKICDTFAGGPHIFNLGHGITPDADPAHVQTMIDTVRSRG